MILQLPFLHRIVASGSLGWSLVCSCKCHLVTEDVETPESRQELKGNAYTGSMTCSAQWTAPTTTTTTVGIGDCPAEYAMSMHSCHCMKTWQYNGAEHSCCSKTRERDIPWCYVQDGATCKGAAVSELDSAMHWDACGKPINEEIVVTTYGPTTAIGST
eukprot:2312771-Amphidinium_carterae.1